MCVSGEIDAMVSAPLNKEAMHEAGYQYEGQTEILGELTSSRPAMVMVVDKMRLMLFTNHMALRAVCDHITKERMLERIVLAHAALRDMGIDGTEDRRRGLEPARRRERHVRARGGRSHRARDRGGARARHRRAGSVPRRHRLPEVARRRLRHDDRALPRPGLDGREAASASAAS